MNLGIDFGSTYTTVSRYRTDHEVLEAYDTGDGVAIPSVVAVNSLFFCHKIELKQNINRICGQGENRKKGL